MLPHQERVRQIYQSTHVQLTIACVIVVAFIVNICEREIDPYPMPYKQYPKTWATLDDIFNTMFLLELLFNLYGTWFCDFWRSGWNIFDLLVVVVGICTITRADLGVFNDLKMLRAFRVFRLFKRVKSLNSIIVNLIQSIPGVLSAFSLTLIVMSVYAILAVEWFRDLAWHDEEGVYDEGRYGTLMDLKVHNESLYEPRNASGITLRRLNYGDEYYGTFLRALYTLFQVMTGESWCENVARPLLFGYHPENATIPGLFFTSFVLLNQLVLTNVIVAVLLDNFTDADDGGNLRPLNYEPPGGRGAGVSEEAAERWQPRIDEISAEISAMDSQLKGVSMSMRRLLTALEHASAEGGVKTGVGGEGRMYGMYEGGVNGGGWCETPAFSETSSTPRL